MKLNVLPQQSAKRTRLRFIITEPVRAPSRRRNHRAFSYNQPSPAIRDHAQGFQGNEASFPWSRSSVETLVHFWFLLLHNKRNYPFRGIHACGQFPLKINKEIIPLASFGQISPEINEAITRRM
jgi:hypothetical protein